MAELFVYAVVTAIAAVFGATAGRVFAVEAENALAAIFAGPYVGAGVGLISGTLLGSPLTLVAQLLNAGSSTWFDFWTWRAWPCCGERRAGPPLAWRSASSSWRSV